MLDHQDDLNADFRAFYRLSPKEAAKLSGPEYFALAWRTVSYDGAMRAVATKAAAETPETTRGAELEDFQRPDVAEFFEID